MSVSKKLISIFRGWKNFKFPSKEIETLAKKRAEICSKCPHANAKHPFKLFVPQDRKTASISKLGCEICGCLISAKVRSPLEKCPQEKW